jgi:ABC-2 type transport system permease protein
MLTMFFKTLKLHRKGLFIWVAVMVLTTVYAAVETPMVMKNLDSIMAAMEMIPRIVMIMFGMGGTSIGTPEGYYLIMYYWFCLITFPHAAFVGASFIAREEHDHTSEFLFSKPFKRQTVVTAKILAGIVNVLVMTVFTCLSTVFILVPAMGDPSMMGAVALTMVGMFLTQLVFMAIGFMCSAWFSSYKGGLSASLLAVFITYAIGVAMEYTGQMEAFGVLSPFRYFYAEALIREGFSPLSILYTVILCTGMVYATYYKYQRRDLRV